MAQFAAIFAAEPPGTNRTPSIFNFLLYSIAVYFFIVSLSKNNGFKPFQWVQLQLKKNGNPVAITEAIEATAKQYPRGFKKEPIAYCQGVFKKLNPKYNELESTMESNGFKQIKPGAVLTELLKNIGKKA